MKKIIAILMLSLLVFTGCESKEEKTEVDNTISGSLVSLFNKEVDAKKSLDKIADTMSTTEIVPLNLMANELKDGDYVEGFDVEISGFKAGYSIKPMIGSIPFIAYVFEVKDAESFAETLEKNANLRWNICTEADEMKTSVNGNYVFFVMNPKSFDE